jgi:hypothetical protein
VASGSAFSNVLKAKEDLQKSPEQLEEEKRSIIAQRIPQLKIDGKSKEALVEQVLSRFILFFQILSFINILNKAKQLHTLLHQLHGSIYELTERFERQKYDVSNRIYFNKKKNLRLYLDG